MLGWRGRCDSLPWEGIVAVDRWVKERKKHGILPWLALFALLVQILLPIAQAQAAALASWDKITLESLCSSHDGQKSPTDSPDNLLCSFCPMGMAGKSLVWGGYSLDLSVQNIVRAEFSLPFYTPPSSLSHYQHLSRGPPAAPWLNLG